MGAIFLVILLGLFPSLLAAVGHLLSFALLSFVGGGLTFLVTAWLGVVAQNAFWISAVIGLLAGAFATHYLRRRRNEHRALDRLVTR